MKNKLLELLAEKFPGTRKDGLEMLARTLAVTITDETEAQELVDKMTTESVNETISAWRSATDKEVQSSIKKNEAGLRNKYDFVEKSAPQPPVDEPKPNPTPAPGTPAGGLDANALQKIIADAVAAATNPLKEQINSMSANRTNASRLEVLQDTIGTDIPVAIRATILDGFKNRTFESDEDFDKFIKETSDTLDVYRQEVADMGLGNFTKPGTAGYAAEKVDAAVQEYIAGIDGNGNDLGGKEI